MMHTQVNILTYALYFGRLLNHLSNFGYYDIRSMDQINKTHILPVISVLL